MIDSSVWYECLFFLVLCDSQLSTLGLWIVVQTRQAASIFQDERYKIVVRFFFLIYLFYYHFLTFYLSNGGNVC